MNGVLQYLGKEKTKGQVDFNDGGKYTKLALTLNARIASVAV